MNSTAPALTLPTAALLLGISTATLEGLIAQGLVQTRDTAAGRQVTVEALSAYEVFHSGRKAKSLKTLLAIGRGMGFSLREMAEIRNMLSPARVN